jgi:hypothetical protein
MIVVRYLDRKETSMLKPPIQKEIKLPIQIPTFREFKKLKDNNKDVFLYEKDGFSVKCQFLFNIIDIRKQNTELPIYRYYYRTKNLYLIEKINNIVTTISNHGYWRVAEHNPITKKLKQSLDDRGEHILVLYDDDPKYSLRFTSQDGLYSVGEFCNKRSKNYLLEYYTDLISNSKFSLELVTDELLGHAKNIIKILEEHN